jgi:hypothetical protein
MRYFNTHSHKSFGYEISNFDFVFYQQNFDAIHLEPYIKRSFSVHRLLHPANKSDESLIGQAL